MQQVLQYGGLEETSRVPLFRFSNIAPTTPDLLRHFSQFFTNFKSTF